MFFKLVCTSPDTSVRLLRTGRSAFIPRLLFFFFLISQYQLIPLDGTLGTLCEASQHHSKRYRPHMITIFILHCCGAALPDQ